MLAAAATMTGSFYNDEPEHRVPNPHFRSGTLNARVPARVHLRGVIEG